MSEMIERVARTMCRHRYENEHMVGLTVSAIQRDLYVDKRWHEYKGMARAAIEAMMEPTMPMLNAAVDATGAGAGMSWANRSPQRLLETGHRAMLSAALHGDQEGHTNE